MLPLSAALILSLAACEQKPQETTYETDVEDVSGGELIVTEETPAVPVDLPTTEMTPVPPETPGSPPTEEATPPAE